MKFVVPSSYLLKQLSQISGVIANNPVIPILENFLFDLKANEAGGTGGQSAELHVTASDLQTTMTLKLEVQSDDTGMIAIPAKILLETLRNLPDQPVTFQVDARTYSLELLSRNGHYKLAGENAVDFPQAPGVQMNGHGVEVPTEVVQKAVSNTLFATSTDDLRPAMTGVLAEIGAESATFVATDGHRLIRYRRDDVGAEGDTSIILPRKALNLLKSSLPTDKEEGTAGHPVQLSFNQSNAFFTFKNVQMICRLIDERFPDYENAIPQHNPNVLTVDRQDLLSSLKRIAIYANKTTQQVRFRVSANELEISAEDLDFSNEATETMPCEYQTDGQPGEPMEIGFNARFLIEMLGNLTSDTVQIALSAPNRAGLIRPTESEAGEDLLMLVMPVMLSNYV